MKTKTETGTEEMARAMEKPIIQGDKHTSMLTYNKVTVAPAKYVCMTTMNIVTFYQALIIKHHNCPNPKYQPKCKYCTLKLRNNNGNPTLMETIDTIGQSQILNFNQSWTSLPLSHWFSCLS